MLALPFGITDTFGIQNLHYCNIAHRIFRPPPPLPDPQKEKKIRFTSTFVRLAKRLLSFRRWHYFFSLCSFLICSFVENQFFFEIFLRRRFITSCNLFLGFFGRGRRGWGDVLRIQGAFSIIIFLIICIGCGFGRTVMQFLSNYTVPIISGLLPNNGEMQEENFQTIIRIKPHCKQFQNQPFLFSIFRLWLKRPDAKYRKKSRYPKSKQIFWDSIH